MRYTQKDIRQAMGIGRDALRLYEERGIIEPEIDPSNGYRHYDDWQMNLLWECKHYQAMGFSLAEVKEILLHEDVTGLATRVSARRESVRREIERLRLVEKNCDAQLEAFERMHAVGTDIRVEKVESLAYVPQREVHDLLLEASGSTLVRFMNDHRNASASTCWFPRLTDPTYYWGFSMPIDTYASLDGPTEGNLPVVLPGGRALVGYVDAGERGGFGVDLLDPLRDEARRLGEVPRGMAYGRLLARTHETDGYHRFVEAVLPVE